MYEYIKTQVVSLHAHGHTHWNQKKHNYLLNSFCNFLFAELIDLHTIFSYDTFVQKPSIIYVYDGGSEIFQDKWKLYRADTNLDYSKV